MQFLVYSFLVYEYEMILRSLFKKLGHLHLQSCG